MCTVPGMWHKYIKKLKAFDFTLLVQIIPLSGWVGSERTLSFHAWWNFLILLPSRAPCTTLPPLSMAPAFNPCNLLSGNKIHKITGKQGGDNGQEEVE